MHRVLAIIVTYNAMPWIDRCLGSVRRAGIDSVVIDNGSTDGTIHYIEDNYPEARLLISSDNLGFGAANNIGFMDAVRGGYDYAYLLNQDAWLDKDTVERLVAASSKEYAIISPVQTDAEGYMDKRFAKRCGRAVKRRNVDAKGVTEVPFVMAAHWLISRRALLEVGGFSPAFKQYGEDDNWIHRAHYFGYKVGVAVNATAVHDRAKRSETKEYRMKLKCVSTVVKISNPCNCLFLRKIMEPVELVCMAAKNFSTIPLRYIPDLLRRYPELSALRKASKQRGAFL